MSKLGALHMSNPTGSTHKATVLFFHGSGGNGADIKEWVKSLMKNFSFPHIKVLYPTAPLQPYTPAGGEMSNVWFDRNNISPNVPENLESMSKIEIEIKKLIQSERDQGIPSNKIIVGGFSMGGALALHTAYRFDQKLAGVFAFSSFLNEGSLVYKELQNASNEQLPPLLQIHGDTDDLVLFKWGEDTFNQLKSLGVDGEFHTMPRLGHSLNRRGLEIIKNWIEKMLPEN